MVQKQHRDQRSHGLPTLTLDKVGVNDAATLYRRGNQRFRQRHQQGGDIKRVNQ